MTDEPLIICKHEAGCNRWAIPKRGARLCSVHEPAVGSPPEAVDHPHHYNAHPSGVECIDIVEHMSFNVGNAVKYLWRADLKNGIEDLRKATWYVQREIERREASSG